MCIRDRGIGVVVVQSLIGLRPGHGVLRRAQHGIGHMHGAGIGNRGAAQRGGHHLAGVGRGDAGIFISCPVGVIHVAHQIGADVLMQVLPLTVLADKVGAIAFPQNVAVLGGAVHLLSLIHISYFTFSVVK